MKPYHFISQFFLMCLRCECELKNFAFVTFISKGSVFPRYFYFFLTNLQFKRIFYHMFNRVQNTNLIFLVPNCCKHYLIIIIMHLHPRIHAND